MSHKLTQQMSHNLESLPRSRDGLWKRRHPRQKFPTFLRSCNLAMVCCCEKMCDFSATCPRFATVSISTSSTSIKCNIDIFFFWLLCCHLYTQAHSEHQEEISKFWDPRFSYHQNNKLQGVVPHNRRFKQGVMQRFRPYSNVWRCVFVVCCRQNKKRDCLS